MAAQGAYVEIKDPRGNVVHGDLLLPGGTVEVTRVDGQKLYLAVTGKSWDLTVSPPFQAETEDASSNAGRTNPK